MRCCDNVLFRLEIFERRRTSCSGTGTVSHAADRTLSEVGKSARALVERLEGDACRFRGLIEQVFIENHIHIIQSIGLQQLETTASQQSQRRMNAARWRRIF